MTIAKFASDNCYYGAASISCPERAAGTIGVTGAGPWGRVCAGVALGPIPRLPAAGPAAAPPRSGMRVPPGPGLKLDIAQPPALWLLWSQILAE